MGCELSGGTGELGQVGVVVEAAVPLSIGGG